MSVLAAAHRCCRAASSFCLHATRVLSWPMHGPLSGAALTSSCSGNRDMLMMGALVSSLATGIISVEEAVQGFSNTGMMTVAALLVVAEAVKITDAIAPVRSLVLCVAARYLPIAAGHWQPPPSPPSTPPLDTAP